jgi:hypothetical protein
MDPMMRLQGQPFIGNMERLQALVPYPRSDDHLRHAAAMDETEFWDLWGAGYMIAGGMGDDSFDYFCDWLIGQGREVFEQALADPDSLANVPAAAEEEVEAEELRYAVQKAYESTHGNELPFGGPTTPAEPAGEEWDEEDVDSLYPRLAARFGP